MEHVVQGDVAGESRHWPLDVLGVEIDVLVVRRNLNSMPNLAPIEIESEDRLPATAFPHIKREQAKSAADIQDRLVRVTKQLVSGRINGIAAQFAPHIATKPEFGKLSGNAGTSRFVFAHFASPVFHLLRILALPD
jgi:hypothetical protein